MKLVTYLYNGHEQLAFLVNGNLYNTDVLHADLPISMAMFLNYWEDFSPLARAVEDRIKQGLVRNVLGIPFSDAEIIAPVPSPPGFRDGYSFRQHVATARSNRGASMIPAFDQYPVFYFGNHNSIQGPGDILCMPDHLEKLDFELEVAIVINKPGRNIKAAEADDYIAGVVILNDISARKLQMEEMLLNLGPAKGKDFCTVTGPMLVTLDELEKYEVPCKEGHTGKNWNLKMTCSVNGVQVSEGNLGDMDWTFAELIERCSYGVNLFPGDIIGSGTVGTGCFLELNGTARATNADHIEQWLKENDLVEMDVEGLGILRNRIVKENSDFSLLAIRKNSP